MSRWRSASIVYRDPVIPLYSLTHGAVPVTIICLEVFAVSLSSISERPTGIPGCYHRVTMSQATPTSSTSNFQSIFDAALKKYEKKTKNDLLAHPLAAQLQACNSPSDILAVLQDKVKEFDQSRSADERLSQWLNPTINVLYSFSATLWGRCWTCEYRQVNLSSSIPLSPISQVFSPASVIFSGIGVLLLVSIVFDPCVEVILTMKSISGGQRCRMPAKMPSSISSSVSRTSSNASSLIPQCRQQTR